MDWRSAPTHWCEWPGEITNLAAKRRVAVQLAQRLRNGDVVGVGSGSTAFLTLEAIAARCSTEDLTMTAIPTSVEIAMVCAEHGIPTTNLTQTRPDWSFDGADEIDPQGNLIKGRGGALFHEKLVMASSPEAYIVADRSKLVDKLGQRCPVPLEIDQQALNLVNDILRADPNVADIRLRPAAGKDGPVITERGNLLLDVRFHEIPDDLDRRINAIPGVIEVGLFMGFRPTVVVAQ